MGLPVIQHPTFELTVPSTGEKLRYRPFLVKEEKILLLAQASEDPAEIIHAIQQILQNCIFEYDVSSFTSFDTEYCFLQLRANSVSSNTTIRVYDEDIDDHVEIDVDFNEIKVQSDKEVDPLIKLNDEVQILLRYPRYDDLVGVNPDEVDTTLEMISKCIDKVYHGEEVLELKDFTPEEIDDFINSFPADAFNNIQEYFTEMPAVTHDVKYTVKVNGKNKRKTKTLRGIADFFS